MGHCAHQRSLHQALHFSIHDVLRASEASNRDCLEIGVLGETGRQVTQVSSDHGSRSCENKSVLRKSRLFQTVLLPTKL